MSISAAYTTERLYAEWFSWVVNAMPGLSRETYHHAAQNAVTAMRTGGDPQAAALQAAHSGDAPGWTAVSDADTRRYAEWYEWARLALGGSAEMTHAAAAAAADRARAGQPPEASMVAAREAAHTVLHPPEPVWAGPVRAVAEPSPYSMGLARDPLRVALGLTFAAAGYYYWFLWQLFALARREGFPRARSFWWILVPIYNWVVIYRTLDDLYDAEARRRGHSGLIPPLVIGLMIVSGFVGRLGSGVAGIAFLGVGFAITAIAGFLIQTSMTHYLTGDDQPGFLANVSVGEVVATIIGLTVTAIFIAAGILLMVDPSLATGSSGS